jgi:hypothetical protein
VQKVVFICTRTYSGCERVTKFCTRLTVSNWSRALVLLGAPEDEERILSSRAQQLVLEAQGDRERLCSNFVLRDLYIIIVLKQINVVLLQFSVEKEKLSLPT